jgi:hypothetical protein
MWRDRKNHIKPADHTAGSVLPPLDTESLIDLFYYTIPSVYVD